MKFCTAIFFCTIFFPGFAEARDLGNRLGIGYTTQIALKNDKAIPALSGKYHFSKRNALSFAAGFDTQSNDNALVLGMKYFRNVFGEKMLNFYTGAGLAFVSHGGTRFQPSLFFGSEFFFEQLPSLGLTFEAGLRADNRSGSFAIETTGDSFLTGGIHFYF